MVNVFGCGLPWDRPTLLCRLRLRITQSAYSVVRPQRAQPMSPQPISDRPLPSCNGNKHGPDCRCGWGGVHYPSSNPAGIGSGSIPPSGTRAVWERTDFSRRTKCPECSQPVFFVRHNGGSVWFDSLGQPWPKHPCMASESDTTWLQEGFTEELEPGNRLVFGIIREAKVGDPGNTAFFIIDCSDGTVIEEEFVYPTLNPCDAIGSMAKLELSPDNRVGERRFKLIDEMLTSNRALRVAEDSRRQRRESEEIERKEVLRQLIEQVKRRRKTTRSMFQDTNSEISRLESMSLKSLRKLQKNGLDCKTLTQEFSCEQGIVKVRMTIDLEGAGIRIIDTEKWNFSNLLTHSSQVTIEVVPKLAICRKLATTVTAAKAEELIDGKEPSTETFWLIYDKLCVKKGITPTHPLAGTQAKPRTARDPAT